jgi:bifunctional non-homologous end joining protein LigD
MTTAPADTPRGHRRSSIAKLRNALAFAPIGNNPAGMPAMRARRLRSVLLQGPVAPMLATPGRALPSGKGWVLEPKWDGWRVIAHVTPDGPRIYTRHGRSYHRRLPALNAALASCRQGTVLDGELVVLEPLEDGRVRCRFDRLSGSMLGTSPHRRSRDRLAIMLIAFDALAVAGDDLRRRPWHARRCQLEQLLDGATGPLRITPILEATPAVHDALVADGWEGTVVKDAASRYRCGRRSAGWVKLKSPAAIARDRARIELTLRRKGHPAPAI